MNNNSKKITSLLPLLSGKTKSLTGYTNKDIVKDVMKSYSFHYIDLKVNNIDDKDQIIELNGTIRIKMNLPKEDNEDMKSLIKELIKKVDHIANDVSTIKEDVSDLKIRVSKLEDIVFKK